MDYKNNNIIKNEHNKAISYLRINYSIKIWKKSVENTYYYRINPFSKKIKITTNDEFLKLIDEDIKVYENIKDVYLEKDVLILVKSLIEDIKDEVFYPHNDREFFKLKNVEYRNTFQNSKFLGNREFMWEEKNVKSIKKYIYNMFFNENEADYLIDWLSFYSKTFDKSSNAIVLIGDKETTDILINQIIRPIFAYKREYFGCINNETLKKSNESILKDKIFYHIDELSKENIGNKKTSKLVLDILKRNKFTCEKAIELEEDYIYGQLIVTSSKENPYPLLKDSYSRCSVFKVKSLENILEYMELDRFMLEEIISCDLYNFSNILFYRNVKWYKEQYFPSKVFETEEKNALPNMKNGVLRTKDLEEKIEEFIKNIKNKNVPYFIFIRDKLFEELRKNFEEDMIAQPLLSTYFNDIYKNRFFVDNNSFLDILKIKDEMFRKTPTDKSKSNGKKRYKIF